MGTFDFPEKEGMPKVGNLRCLRPPTAGSIHGERAAAAAATEPLLARIAFQLRIFPEVTYL